jgi:hypothetical protein
MPIRIMASVIVPGVCAVVKSAAPPACAEEEQHRGRAPWPKRVQRPAHRKLHQREGREPQARGAREIPGRRADICRQRRGEHGEERAIELAEHVGDDQEGDPGAHELSLFFASRACTGEGMAASRRSFRSFLSGLLTGVAKRD